MTISYLDGAWWAVCTFSACDWRVSCGQRATVNECAAEHLRATHRPLFADEAVRAAERAISEHQTREGGG